MLPITLNDILEQQARATPEKDALFFSGQYYSYQQLNNYANKIARNFLAIDIQQGQKIALLLEHSFTLIATIFAILKCGCAYVPLDENWPQERINYILTDSDCTLIVVSNKFINQLQSVKNLCLIDNLIKDNESPDNKEDLKLEISSYQLAYIIYTSGTTGNPKGVGVTHENVLQLLDATHLIFNFSQEERWLMFHSVAFDFSVWELFGAFYFKNLLFIYEHDFLRNPENVLQILKENGITILNQTPTAFLMLTTNISYSDILQTKLKYVIFGGEKFYLKYIDNFIRDDDCQINFVNMYGITEATVHATYYLIPRHSTSSLTKSIIGKPLPNVKLFIDCVPLELTSTNTEGELGIASRMLATGYVNLENLTNSRFIFIDENTRLFKTGDIVRLNESGMLEYIGRRDKQIKLNGYRIELGEIEAALLDHPAIIAAKVTYTELDTITKYLTAYYQLIDEHELKEETIIEFLLTKIPQYTLPMKYVLVEKFDITHNGKLVINEEKTMSYPLNLTPKTKAFLMSIQPTAHLPFGNPSIAEYRELAKGFKTMAGPIAHDVVIKDLRLSIGENQRWLKVKTFLPQEFGDSQLLPTLLFFPGGGFIANLECHDSPCSIIASTLRCRVILINYSLAPEYKYPSGLNDVYSAIKYLHLHADKFGIVREKFFIAGDSSGATLLIQSAIKIRDEGNIDLIKHLIIISPTTDFSLSVKSHEKESSVNAFQPGLLEYIFRHYFSEGYDFQRDRTLSPVFSSLHRLPKTSIFVAEYDGLRSHAEAYHEKLIAAGTASELYVSPGQIHQTFLGRGMLSDGENPIEQVCVALKRHQFV